MTSTGRAVLTGEDSVLCFRRLTCYCAEAGTGRVHVAKGPNLVEWSSNRTGGMRRSTLGTVSNALIATLENFSKYRGVRAPHVVGDTLGAFMQPMASKRGPRTFVETFFEKLSEDSANEFRKMGITESWQLTPRPEVLAVLRSTEPSAIISGLFGTAVPEDLSNLLLRLRPCEPSQIWLRDAVIRIPSLSGGPKMQGVALKRVNVDGERALRNRQSWHRVVVFYCPTMLHVDTVMACLHRTGALSTKAELRVDRSGFIAVPSKVLRGDFTKDISYADSWRAESCVYTVSEDVREDGTLICKRYFNSPLGLTSDSDDGINNQSLGIGRKPHLEQWHSTSTNEDRPQSAEAAFCKAINRKISAHGNCFPPIGTPMFCSNYFCGFVVDRRVDNVDSDGLAVAGSDLDPDVGLQVLERELEGIFSETPANDAKPPQATGPRFSVKRPNFLDSVPLDAVVYRR